MVSKACALRPSITLHISLCSLCAHQLEHLVAQTELLAGGKSAAPALQKA